MSNTINLLPIRTKDQIKLELIKFKYDLLTAIIILAIVLIGVILLFVNAFLQYSISSISSLNTKGENTLKSYTDLAGGYYTVQEKVKQAKIIQKNTINPTDIINYLENLLPNGSGMSDLTIGQGYTFTVTISSTDYLNIAKLLFSLENPNLKVKNTDIKQINYVSDSKTFNFIITGIYSQNG